MSNVIKPTEFNANNITGTTPVRKGDRLQALLLYNQTPFLVETPALKIPFGVNRFGEKSDGSIDASKALGAYSMNMSAQGKDPERQEAALLRRCHGGPPGQRGHRPPEESHQNHAVHALPQVPEDSCLRVAAAVHGLACARGLRSRDAWR